MKPEQSLGDPDQPSNQNATKTDEVQSLKPFAIAFAILSVLVAALESNSGSAGPASTMMGVLGLIAFVTSVFRVVVSNKAGWVAAVIAIAIIFLISSGMRSQEAASSTNGHSASSNDHLGWVAIVELA